MSARHRWSVLCDRATSGSCTPLGRTPVPAVVAGVVMIGAGAVAFTQLDRSVLPRLKETDLLIRWDGPPGASLPEMDRITTRATEELRGLDGVRSVDAHVGRAIRGDAVGGASTGEIWVSLDPDADYDGTITSIEERGQRLSRPRSDGAHLLAEPDQRRAGQRDDAGAGAGLRAGAGRAAGEGRRDRVDPGRYRRGPGRPRPAHHHRAHDRDRGGSRRQRRLPASSPATFAAPPPPWSRASRSARSSKSRRSSKCRCGASRRSAAA